MVVHPGTGKTVVYTRNQPERLSVVTTCGLDLVAARVFEDFEEDIRGLPSRHAGVDDRRQQPDGTAGASSVDVRLQRRRGDRAVRRRRGRGSDLRPRSCSWCRWCLRLDVERRKAANDVERIRRRDATTAVTSRNAGYISTAG